MFFQHINLNVIYLVKLLVIFVNYTKKYISGGGGGGDTKPHAEGKYFLKILNLFIIK